MCKARQLVEEGLIFLVYGSASRGLVFQACVVVPQLKAIVGVDDDHHEVTSEEGWGARLARLWQGIVQILVLPLDEQLGPSTRVCTHFCQVVDVWISAVIPQIIDD